MELNNKIKRLREVSELSQEEMAEKMHMSTNSYGRIERGEVKISLERLEQIAAIFKIDVAELISKPESGLIFLVTAGDGSTNHYYGNPVGNSSSNHPYYGNTEALVSENEKLKLMLAHKDAMLEQKDREINLLKKLLDTFEK